MTGNSIFVDMGRNAYTWAFLSGVFLGLALMQLTKRRPLGKADRETRWSITLVLLILALAAVFPCALTAVRLKEPNYGSLPVYGIVWAAVALLLTRKPIVFMWPVLLGAIIVIWLSIGVFTLWSRAAPNPGEAWAVVRVAPHRLTVLRDEDDKRLVDVGVKNFQSTQMDVSVIRLSFARGWFVFPYKYVYIDEIVDHRSKIVYWRNPRKPFAVKTFAGDFMGINVKPDKLSVDFATKYDTYLK